MTETKQTLSYATIHWRDSKTPASEQFDDVYYSQTDGLEETRYVFLHHNRLSERWKQLDSNNNAGQFIIIETGFGTGLNFLATWQLWDTLAPSNWTLHFISIEKFPLRLKDLKKSTEPWPQLSTFSKQLIDSYPTPTPGTHTLSLCSPDTGKNIQLHLLIGDAHDCLAALIDNDCLLPALGTSWKTDSWFLDGFAPAKNPDMWRPALYDRMQQLSYKNTTFATFTAAGIVKRGLKEAGFHVEKVPGFGTKRDMLAGQFIN